ncbi:hypothetical protein L7F22_067377 [Adiantum nelumboides]|nr:hypothetical protein [Adiantum nelumboides]
MARSTEWLMIIAKDNLTTFNLYDLMFWLVGNTTVYYLPLKFATHQKEARTLLCNKLARSTSLTVVGYSNVEFASVNHKILSNISLALYTETLKMARTKKTARKVSFEDSKTQDPKSSSFKEHASEPEKEAHKADKTSRKTLPKEQPSPDTKKSTSQKRKLFEKEKKPIQKEKKPSKKEKKGNAKDSSTTKVEKSLQDIANPKGTITLEILDAQEWINRVRTDLEDKAETFSRALVNEVLINHFQGDMDEEEEDDNDDGGEE